MPQLAPRSLLISAALVLTPAAQAGTFFSLDAESPTLATTGFTAADVLTPGSAGGPPLLAIAGTALGLVAGDELDAISLISGHPLAPSPEAGLVFSVDRASVGVPGPAGPNVFTEALAGQAAGDLFLASPASTGVLLENQSTLGLVPAVGPGVPFAGTQDNLDALELTLGDAPLTPGDLVFSLAAGSPTLAALGLSAADLLMFDPVTGLPTALLSATALGLDPADDIDALLGVTLEGFTGIYSVTLAPGSPSLAEFGIGPSDVLGLVDPASPIFPILVNNFGLTPPIIDTMSEVAFGVADGDNVDALAAFTPPVPEPSTWAMLLAGLGLVGAAARRRLRA